MDIVALHIRSFFVGYVTAIRFNYEAGKLRIYYLYEQTDLAQSGIVPDVYATVIPTYQYKYVVIPGTQAGRQSAPPVDYNDYEAVKRYYNLPD
jgi:hypothetical protein